MEEWYRSDGWGDLPEGPARMIVDRAIMMREATGRLVELARSAGDVDDAREAIQAGADVNHTFPNGLTPLHLLAMHHGFTPNNRMFADLLLQSGAAPFARDGDGETPLDVAHRWGNQSMIHTYQSFRLI